jgi:hypothetical protein
VDNNRSDKSGAHAAEQNQRAESRRVPFTVPTGCTEKHGRYYLIAKNKWHPLSRVADGAIPFWRAYYRLTKVDPEFMAGVFIAFIEDGMPDRIARKELTAGTAKKYEGYILTRLIPYCGHIHRSDINPSHVARYLEERKKAGAPIAANRERAAWASACDFAMRRGWMRKRTLKTKTSLDIQAKCARLIRGGGSCRQ